MLNARLISVLMRTASRILNLRTPIDRNPKEAENSQKEHIDVLFVNGCDLETLRRYRVLHQREQLEIRGVSTGEVHYTQVQPSDASRAGTFIIYRCPITEGVRSFIEAAHLQSKRVFFDIDDLVIDTRFTNELPMVKCMNPEEKAIFDDGVRRTGMTLALCDAAIVTTEHLSKEIGKIVPEVIINRNVASKEMVARSNEAYAAAPSEKKNGTVTLGYFSGSMTHNTDFLEVLPTLTHIMSTYSNVRLKTVGELSLPKELTPFADRIDSSPYVPWTELPALIRTADINLAPLENTLFNEAKSENKWTEAGLVGVPTVVSNIGAFTESINNGIDGFLCSTTEEWIKALTSLIERPDLRAEVGNRARNRCLRERTTLAEGQALVASLLPEQRTISQLTPSSLEDTKVYTNSYLLTRGITPHSIAFDAKPWASFSLNKRLKQAKALIAAGKRLLVTVYEKECGDTATFRYFGYNVAQQLENSSKWGSTFVFIEELEEAHSLLELTNAISLIRCRLRPELIQLAKWAKAIKKPLAYLIDDNALGAPSAPAIINIMASDPSDQFERDFWTGTCVRFELASRLADCFIVPNSYFAELLGKHTTKPRFVAHSFLNAEQLSLSKQILDEQEKGAAIIPADQHFTIGYFSGTASHQDDFELAKPATLSFLSEVPSARLLIGGEFRLDDDLLPFLRNGQLILMPRVDYTTLQYLQASVDIVIAPLVDSEFANCKSALKVYEAGIVCTPACASPTAGYREAIINGKTGFLCKKTTDWLRAFKMLLNDRKYLQLLQKGAHEYALHHYSGPNVTTELEETLDGLLNTKCLPLPPEVEKALQNKKTVDWNNPFDASPAFARDA